MLRSILQKRKQIKPKQTKDQSVLHLSLLPLYVYVLLQPVLFLNLCVLRLPVLPLYVYVLQPTLQPFECVCSTGEQSVMHSMCTCYTIVCATPDHVYSTGNCCP
jgi:hypothetical protein